MPVQCESCRAARARVRRPASGAKLCAECFLHAFESEVHRTIVAERLFSAGERVAIGASGGKDSTVLAYVLKALNERHAYGLDLFLLSVDEGISGYRDDSLAAVHRNRVQYGLPLHVVSYAELYDGWTMDSVVRQIGRTNNCTFCGVLRRQALDRGAAFMRADKLVTGHNADDLAETVLLNLVRGDAPRLARCADAITGDGAPHGDDADEETGKQQQQRWMLPRVKPFKYTYEKEIVMYAHMKQLDYFATECVYAPQSYRSFAREFLKELEALRPRAVLDTVASAERFRASLSPSAAMARTTSTAAAAAAAAKVPNGGIAAVTRPGRCERCGYMTSQRFCKACVLLAHLKAGKGSEATRSRNRGGGDGVVPIVSAAAVAPSASSSRSWSSSSSAIEIGRPGDRGRGGGGDVSNGSKSGESDECSVAQRNGSCDCASRE